MARDVSEIMRKIHSSDTAPEISFRKALWSKGLRYRKSVPDLPGKPDVVFPSKRLAVFVDGDFWHGGQWRHRKLDCLEDQFQNTANRGYWVKKITRNVERDRVATDKLLADGWNVLRFWESDLKKDLAFCVDLTIRVLSNNMRPTPYGFLTTKTVAEFFAGIGLIRMGLEQHGWSVSFANDNDPNKKSMYTDHFKDTNDNYKTESIWDLSCDDIPTVSIATASFPCNDLSLAGARRGINNGHSSTFWAFTQLMDQMDDRKPPIILIENVSGFLTSNKGADFFSAVSELNRIGYSVDAFIIDASRFVPQSRIRLFLVGVLSEGLDTLCLREYALEESDIRPKPLVDFISKNPNLDWNIRKLPPLPSHELTVESVLEDLPEDAPEWWSHERAQYLYNQMSERHQNIVDSMMVGDRFSYGTVFRRMRKGRSMAEIRTDGLAGCLRTPRGGSAKQILVKAGMGQFYARLLTPRECASLMGAGDFAISVPVDQAFFGFGDAVCVPVIEWIGKNYLNNVVNEMIRGLPLKRQREQVRF